MFLFILIKAFFGECEKQPFSSGHCRILKSSFSVILATASLSLTLQDASGDGGEDEDAGEDDRPDSVASKTNEQEPKCTNQFNFIERASQTLNNALRVGLGKNPISFLSFFLFE